MSLRKKKRPSRRAAAQDRARQVAVQIGPRAKSAGQSAAEQIGPLAQSARETAQQIGPLAKSARESAVHGVHSARDWSAPHVQHARDWSAPHVQHARDWSAPHVQHARDWSAPHVQHARDWSAPHVQHARDWSGPHVQHARDWSGPRVEQAVQLAGPKVSAALEAAAHRLEPAPDKLRDLSRRTQQRAARSGQARSRRRAMIIAGSAGLLALGLGAVSVLYARRSAGAKQSGADANPSGEPGAQPVGEAESGVNGQVPRPASSSYVPPGPGHPTG